MRWSCRINAAVAGADELVDAVRDQSERDDAEEPRPVRLVAQRTKRFTNALRLGGIGVQGRHDEEESDDAKDDAASADAETADAQRPCVGGTAKAEEVELIVEFHLPRPVELAETVAAHSDAD